MRTADRSSLTARRFGYADTPWGQLHYAEQGDGPAMLLLHQTPRSWDEFREVQPLLATGRRVVAMDMVGFGQSAAVPAPQSIEHMAAGGFALLDALGIPQAVVLGHHTGGAVAVEMAAAQPERVPALVLSSAPWVDQHFRESHAGPAPVDNAEVQADGGHLTRLWAQRQPYYPKARPDLLDRFIRDALAPDVDPAEGHRAVARYVMDDRIGLVKAPTLVLGADADPFAFPQTESLRDHLTASVDVRVEVVAGGMIPLMEGSADAVARAVLSFLFDIGL